MFLSAIAELIAKAFAALGLSVTLSMVPLSAAGTPTQDASLHRPTNSRADSLMQEIAPDPSTVPRSGTNAQRGDSTLPAGSAWLNVLPLGDNKYVTNGPKKGYIYLCHVGGDGGGAQAAGTWIDESTKTWNPGEKLHVLGSVSWPNASITTKLSGASRVITINDLPVSHTSGIFPIGASDPASQFDRNPNSISAQSFTFTFPVTPTVAATPGCIFGEVGVMTSGVILFDGFDAGYRDAAAWEVQDHCDAHPQVSGLYHYHSLSGCLKNIAVDNVIGYAFDGFPITGPKLESGNYLKTADLDECHGLTSEITMDGKRVTMYHYVMTQDFPYSVSCFKGKSTQKGPLGGGGGVPSQQVTQGDITHSSGVPQPNTAAGSPPAGGPPQEAISACVNRATGDSCSFVSPMGDTITGHCDTPPNSSLACVPR